MRIMTWNIQWGRGADGRVDLDRTIAAIRHAGAVDVICLQEVARNFPGLPGGAREDELALLAGAFPDHAPVYAAALDVPDGEGGRAQFGNLLLSRVAVDQVFRHQLPYPGDGALPGMARVCIEAVLDSPRGGLRVLTTHLEYYSQRQRRAQVGALRALQEEAASHAAVRRDRREKNPAFAARPRPLSAVLCGDFNCQPGSAEYRRLQRSLAGGVSGWCDAWRILHGDAPHPPTVGLHGAEWPGHAYCCDFFFVSADLGQCVRGLEVLADTDASDHQPVVLELERTSP